MKKSDCRGCWYYARTTKGGPLACLIGERPRVSGRCSHHKERRYIDDEGNEVPRRSCVDCSHYKPMAREGSYFCVKYKVQGGRRRSWCCTKFKERAKRKR